MGFVKGFYQIDENNYSTEKHLIKKVDGTWLIYEIDYSKESYSVVGYFGTLDLSMEYVLDVEEKDL